jgi:FKBP-type peptidyl-prolyl cis-trans isomerase FklB
MLENGLLGLIDREAFVRAFVAALDSQACQLTEPQLQSQMMALQLRQQTARNKAFEGVRAEGEAFLAENAKKEGVQTTATGLQYKVVKAGNGPKPTIKDKVKVHYHGTLIDGTVFDSSIDRGEPVEFQVTGVIPGWTEALQLMPVGSKWTLWIPAQLAYGENSPGDEIPPYSTLVFDVELLGIPK